MSEVAVKAAGGFRRIYAGEDGHVRAVAVEAAGRRIPVRDLGFVLVVDGKRIGPGDLRASPSDPSLAHAGRRLSWRLEGGGLAVDVVAEGEARSPVVRTRLAVSGRGRLERVEVERWGDVDFRGPDDVADARQLGQPVWGPGLFAGLEHPGAENVVRRPGPHLGEAAFGVPVDVVLGANPYVSPSCVVGGSSPGQERAAFWDELDNVRPVPPRLVVLANNWYQLGAVGRMDESTVAAELAGFGEVAERHRLALDHYCLDDPWDGEWTPKAGLWGRLAPDRFPGGLPRLQELAAEAGVGSLGLWVSPWGGYFDRHDARVRWGGEHGYEVQDGRWPCLCPAGDRYRAHVADALERGTAAGVRYWKLDGVQFDCAHPEHGHAVGPAGRTDQMDRFATLLDGVRAVDPDVVLTFTTGSNPSPWWLRHADFVWRGGLDDDAPADCEGGRHERFATYIDGCLDALRGTALPVSAIVTFSLVENQARAYRDEAENPDAWARHCWLLAGRGTLHHDLYVAPDSLSDGEWAVLARALAWARANQAILARSRMVGGRPQAGEPYGFVSSGQGRVIVCLRNPSASVRGIELAGVDLGGEAEDLRPVWGRAAVPDRIGSADTVGVELAPFEVALVSGRLVGSGRPAGAGPWDGRRGSSDRTTTARRAP